MIDLKLLKERLDEAKTNIKNRFVDAKADLVIKLHDEKNALQTELEHYRNERNSNAELMKKTSDTTFKEKLINQGKSIKEQISHLEDRLNDTLVKLNEEALKLPNYAHPDAPLGKDDDDARELKIVGSIPSFNFKALDHVQLGEKLNLINFEAGTKVSGSKFYFLKNQAVLLEWALVRYAMDVLQKKGFELYQTPDIAKEEILVGIGFNPRGEESNIYPLEGTGTCLVGTAEITLGGYYANEIINLENGPLLLAGVSHCFRREAGSAGQFSKGLYRVHQFTKVEMFVFCKPDESNEIHEQLRVIEEEIFTNLGLTYRVIDTPVGALGAPAYRKYDLEAWMPGRGENGDWGEVTSTSNCTDFQARRLNVRFKESSGKSCFAHTLNGTAIAVSRAIVAILENYQESDGSVRMPNVLVPYLGFDRIQSTKS